MGVTLDPHSGGPLLHGLHGVLDLTREQCWPYSLQSLAELEMITDWRCLYLVEPALGAPDGHVAVVLVAEHPAEELEVSARKTDDEVET